MIRLSVLDQSTVVAGRMPDTSIRETLEFARHCEALGYTRYWVAEHHNSDSPGRDGTGNSDQRHRRHDAAHPRRQRRRDAAALLQPESRRAVPRAGGDCARGGSTCGLAAPPAPTDLRHSR
jgi:hypothetical protein